MPIIPVIRFKEFNKKTELTKTPASEIFETINERNFSDLPVLSASQEFGMVYRNENGGSSISYNKDNLSSYKHIYPGQFAIHLRSFQGGFAHSDKEGICSPAYTIMRFKTPIHDEYYWKYLLTSEKFIKRLELITYGIRDGRSISFEDFSTFKFDIPTLNEQKDIGTFFTHITSLIASTQEKLEKTIILKKSMLEKLFPKNGANVPELRFKGFSGEWEEKYLGDCFTERDERSAEGELISVTINQGVVRAKDLDRIDSSSNDKSNYKVVSKGDLAYNTMRMWQGAEGYSPYDGILSPAYTVCIPSNDIHTQFFAYMFKKNHIIHQFKINSQGLTSDTWNLKFNNFALIKVRVPNIDEQKTIANYFENTDKLISSYNDELEKLKTIKKSLLEKMFV